MGKGQEAADTLLDIKKKNSYLCESSTLDEGSMEAVILSIIRGFKNLTRQGSLQLGLAWKLSFLWAEGWTTSPLEAV